MKLQPGEARIEYRPSSHRIGYDWVAFVLDVLLVEGPYFYDRSFCDVKRELKIRGYRLVSVPDVNERGRPVVELT